MDNIEKLKDSLRRGAVDRPEFLRRAIQSGITLSAAFIAASEALGLPAEAAQPEPRRIPSAGIGKEPLTQATILETLKSQGITNLDGLAAKAIADMPKSERADTMVLFSSRYYFLIQPR